MIGLGRERNYGEVHVLLGLGQALAAQNKTQEAADALQRASQMAHETGDQFIEARVLQALRALTEA